MIDRNKLVCVSVISEGLNFKILEIPLDKLAPSSLGELQPVAKVLETLETRILA